MEKESVISEKLRKARAYEKIENKTVKQTFHVCAPVGWMNDPNGFSEYQGKKHLFFQYHPYETQWGPMHWGHMISDDLIHWESLPVALAPDEEYDGFGCFSGSAIEWQGKHVLAYTGVQRVEADGGTKDYQRQCIAVGDGLDYKKIQENPVISEDMIPAGGSITDFRDPKIWAEDDLIYMVVGNRAEDGSGQILMYKSDTLTSWEYVTVLSKCNNRYGKMWECPDFFTLGEKRVLMVSPQEMQAVEHDFHAGDGSIAIIGTYDAEHHCFYEEKVQALDMGLDFYAPQTMETSDGRRIMIAWLQAWCVSWFGAEDGFCGMMTIPRELTLRNGHLFQNPVSELNNYYHNRQFVMGENLGKDFKQFHELSGRIQNLDIVIESDQNYVFEMKLAAKGEIYTLVRYDKEKELLTIDRSHSGVRKDAAHERSVKVLSNNSKFLLRVVMDRYSVELFINDGEQAMSTVIRTPEEMDEVYMRAHGNALISVEKHEIHLN